jgi:hypothetical protein
VLPKQESEVKAENCAVLQSFRKLPPTSLLSDPTLWFEAIRTTLPNLARGVANRMDSASWGKFQQLLSPSFVVVCHIFCRRFPQFA